MTCRQHVFQVLHRAGESASAAIAAVDAGGRQRTLAPVYWFRYGPDAGFNLPDASSSSSSVRFRPDIVSHCPPLPARAPGAPPGARRAARWGESDNPRKAAPEFPVHENDLPARPAVPEARLQMKNHKGVSGQREEHDGGEPTWGCSIGILRTSAGGRNFSAGSRLQ